MRREQGPVKTVHGLRGHELLIAGVQDERRSLDQGSTAPISLVSIKRTRRSPCPGGHAGLEVCG